MKTSAEFIFELARAATLPLEGGELQRVDPAGVAWFARQYMKRMGERDTAVAQHLAGSRPAQRVYLPYSPRAFNTALQTAWYFDELIVEDPILVALSGAQAQMQGLVVARVVAAVQALWSLRAAFDAGLVVLAGRLLKPSTMDLFAEEYLRDVLSTHGVKEELEAATRCGVHEFHLDDGQSGRVYRFELDHSGGFQISGSLKVTPQGIAVPLPFEWTQYAVLTLAEMESALGVSGELSSGTSFSDEIAGTLASAVLASEMGSNLLCDRRVDVAILDAARNGVDGNVIEFGRETVFRLPYMKNVDPSKLVELRMSDPMAFSDFRAHILANPGDGLSLQTRALEVEMATLAARAKMVGATGGGMLGLGLMTAVALGAPSQALSLALPGAGLLLHELLVQRDRRKAMASGPLRFYWEASRLGR